MIISVSLKRACASGGHATVGVIVDGGAEQIYEIDVDDIRTNIQEDEREATLQKLLRLSFAGLTRQQARTKAQNGFTITL